jgi:hypothetical protein
MMREIEGVTAEATARRRWFHDNYFDLFVWQNEGGDVMLFELCYGTDSSERALVWHKDRGFFHDGVEEGSGEVIGTGPAGSDPVLSRLTSVAAALPDEIRRPVIKFVREFVEKKPGARARRKQFRRADWQQKKIADSVRTGGAGKRA